MFAKINEQKMKKINIIVAPTLLLLLLLLTNQQEGVALHLTKVSCAK